MELPVGAQRIVALVALRGRLSRSRVAGSLWPDTVEHRALASLRTGIWRVNRAAPILRSGSNSIELVPQVRVDVQELVRLSRALLRGEDVDVTALDLIEADVELLPDWEDEWLASDRERLRQLRLHMVESLATRFLDQGRFGLALEAAMAALRADDLRESAHRTVIRVHMAEGNLSEARRAYDTCYSLLMRELGTAPSTLTRQMVAAS